MTTIFIRFLKFVAACVLSASLGRAETVVLSEIMYHPASETKPEYVVLLNNSATPLDIANWRVTEGVAYEFPSFSVQDPAATFLRPHEQIVLSGDSPGLTRSAYSIPGHVRVFGPWQGKLKNEGERITVRDKNGAVVCSVKYGARGHWPVSADGAGHALALKNPNEPIDHWRNWMANAGPNAIPGLRPETNTGDGSRALRLNEVHFGNDSEVAWVEVYNPLTQPVSLAGISVSARHDLTDRLELSGEIAPRGHRSWEFKRRLKNGELTLYLVNPDRIVLDAHVFTRPRLGDTWQAFPDGGCEWYSTRASSRDATNQPPLPPSVVVSEILCDQPLGQGGSEFVELFNRGTKAIDLSDWELSEGARFSFPKGTSISAGGFLVVARDTNRMRAAYGELPLVGNWAGKLKNRGELIRLSDSFGNLVNQVDFKVGGAWPNLAAGRGSSLELINPEMDNRRASAWADSDESEKTVFKIYASTNIYQELNPIGTSSDFRKLQFRLANAGHVAIRHIQLLHEGTNLLANSGQLSTNGYSQKRCLGRGTHAASFFTNGELHILADGHGDNRANQVELEVPELRPGQICTLVFEARWLAGSPRLIVESWDHTLGGSYLVEPAKNLGTPGKINSRFKSLPPPQLDDLRHSPAVPRSADPVTVRVTATGVLHDVFLVHRADSADGRIPWQRKRMQPQPWPNEQTYGTELTDYQTNGCVVQFYVQAVSENGLLTVLPREGTERPALWVVDDRPLPRDLRVGRYVVSAQDLETMAGRCTSSDGHQFPRLSNHYFNSTYIENEERIFYGAAVRNSGSPRTRKGDLRKIKLKLPDDQPWRGRTRFSFDDDAAHGTAYHNRMARYLLYLLGHPANENEFIRAVVNVGPVELREDVEPIGNAFLKRNFANGGHGELYRIDDDWRFVANGEGVSEDAEWTYKGNDEANHYRTAWMKRTREAEDDFSALIHLFKTISTSNAAPGQLENLVDTRAILHLASVRGWIGDWDNFTMLRGRNGYLYRRPGDGRFQFLHWDSDEAFIPGQPLYGERLRDWIETPSGQEIFLKDIMTLLRICADEPRRLQTWLELEKESTGGSVVQANYLNFFRIRANEIRSWLKGHHLVQTQIPSEPPVEPTSIAH